MLHFPSPRAIHLVPTPLQSGDRILLMTSESPTSLELTSAPPHCKLSRRAAFRVVFLGLNIATEWPS